MITETSVSEFLNIFFRLHDAIVKEYKILENYVEGKVYWLPDTTDVQIFRWYIDISEEHIQRLTLFCEFLATENLIYGDRIKVSESDLIRKLESRGWSIDEIKSAIGALMETEIKMVDDGEETDSFFIHF